MTWTPGNMHSRYAPWEPHTNQGEIFFCILPYLCDFSWLKVFSSAYLCIQKGLCQLSAMVVLEIVLESLVQRTMFGFYNK